MPKGTILTAFGGTGGKVKTVRVHETSVLRVEGGPERALVQHFARNVFQHASRNEFFRSFCRFGRDWGPIGDPWGDFFVMFSILFQRSIFAGFWNQFGEGPAEGAGSV